MKQPIFFDVDGVLINGYNYKEELRNPWDENLKNDLGICPTIFTQEFIFKRFSKEVIVGKNNLHTALTEELPKMGYDIDAQIVIDYWLEKDSVINNRTLSYVERLKNSGNFSLFIATNQEHNRAQYLMENLEFNKFFEDIFHSAKIGCAKKDLNYFKCVDELLNIPHNVTPIFFDDTPEIVQNAKDHGWDAYLFETADDILACETLSPYLL